MENRIYEEMDAEENPKSQNGDGSITRGFREAPGGYEELYLSS